MTTPTSFEAYRCSARSIGAKSAGALALGASLLSSSEALAQITVYTPTSGNVASIGSGRENQYVWFNFASGQIQNGSIFDGANGYVYTAGDRSYITHTGAGIEFDVDGVSAHHEAYAQPLSLGATINGGIFDFRGFFNLHGGSPATVWNDVTGYIGFRIATDGGFHYGWANVTTDSHATMITVNSFAVNETLNGSITAGEGASAVPEPATSAALLAAGAAGLAIYRKRKNLQRAA